jgi:hypothetical protein
MPRRNRNAHARAIEPEELDRQTRELATELSQSDRINDVLDWAGSWQAEIIPLPPVCVGCFANPATEGSYCLPCKGRIILDARKATVKRR